jgi:hypothetical protein
MPRPRKGESRNTYVSRAVDYIINKEGLSQKAAVGKAEGMYTYYSKNKKRKVRRNIA